MRTSRAASRDQVRPEATLPAQARRPAEPEGTCHLSSDQSPYITHLLGDWNSVQFGPNKKSHRMAGGWVPATVGERQWAGQAAPSASPQLNPAARERTRVLSPGRAPNSRESSWSLRCWWHAALGPACPRGWGGETFGKGKGAGMVAPTKRGLCLRASEPLWGGAIWPEPGLLSVAVEPSRNAEEATSHENTETGR